MPPNKAPTTVPHNAIDIIKKPWNHGEVFHNSFIGRLAPEITTVSKPNMNPANAAMIDTQYTNSVPWLKFENNKIVLKFSDLANLVNFVGDASKQLEETEMKDTKILVESEKIKSAQLLDRYSPAVVKEFVLQYVLGAESSTDYIRITNMTGIFIFSF